MLYIATRFWRVLIELVASEEQEGPLGTSGYLSEGKLGSRVPSWVGCAGTRKKTHEMIVTFRCHVACDW